MRVENRFASAKARRVYYKRLRQVSGPDKIRQMSAMHAQGRRLVRAQIRNTHPDFSDEQVELEARRRFLSWSR